MCGAGERTAPGSNDTNETNESGNATNASNETNETETNESNATEDQNQTDESDGDDSGGDDTADDAPDDSDEPEPSEDDGDPEPDDGPTENDPGEPEAPDGPEADPGPESESENESEPSEEPEPEPEPEGPMEYTFRLTVEVVDQDGQPVEGEPVGFSHADPGDEPAYHQSTDENGETSIVAGTSDRSDVLRAVVIVRDEQRSTFVEADEHQRMQFVVSEQSGNETGGTNENDTGALRIAAVM